MSLTEAQHDALCSLCVRGKTGIFDRTQVIVAAGERLGVMRGTWNRLIEAGFITRDGKRLTVTSQGEARANVSKFTDKAIADEME